ncbi:hypothetical protein ACPCHT_14925 [Nucisporomicrobium flavum]|uniref:hypothetical protein n=1 Tax=Nucisporomicrobium flavum TaxID=2785915 RepID=UPI003C2EAC95
MGIPMDTNALSILFERIGELQHGIDDRTISVHDGSEQILALWKKVVAVLPPGNGHVREGLAAWIMTNWATAQQQYGDSASEQWRQFLERLDKVQ